MDPDPRNWDMTTQEQIRKEFSSAATSERREARMMKSIDEILETEVSGRFIQGMKDRMVVSYHKYGPVEDAYPHKVDAMASMEARVAKYRETGNTEFLVDAANFLMIEFMRPRRTGAFFRGTDSDQSPGRVTAEGKTTWKKNEDIES